MKNAKILTAIVLGCSLLFLMCSCSNVPAKAEDFPECYVADPDGDGENELICNCTYGADGTQRVFIFRNNAGIIEVGSFDETRMAREIGHEYSILPDDFSFSNYVPGEAI